MRSDDGYFSAKSFLTFVAAMRWGRPRTEEKKWSAEETVTAVPCFKPCSPTAGSFMKSVLWCATSLCTYTPTRNVRRLYRKDFYEQTCYTYTAIITHAPFPFFGLAVLTALLSVRFIFIFYSSSFFFLLASLFTAFILLLSVFYLFLLFQFFARYFHASILLVFFYGSSYFFFLIPRFSTFALPSDYSRVCNKHALTVLHLFACLIFPARSA